MSIKNPSVETVKALFGDHPEDVISPIKSAADALDWLKEIFQTIAVDAFDPNAHYRIERLAKAGAHLAVDIGEYAGRSHEDYLDRLIAAGVVHPSAAEDRFNAFRNAAMNQDTDEGVTA